jgi:uncharacterized protein with HEPN domain
MRAKDRDRLQHMLDATRRARQLVAARTRADLDADDVLTLALTRLIEILGEAAKNVSGETQALAPGVPWRQIAGTRDRLIHGYFAVDLDVLWGILVHDLPALEPELEGLLEALDT